MGEPRPRVLLVEDDALLQQFVSMALLDVELELLCCATVAQARSVLRAGAVQLVITDLNLPDQPGLELIEQLHADATLRRGARIVVLSAGLDAAPLRERLRQLGVWRLLHKPVALEALEHCVREALQAAVPTTPGAATPASPASRPAAPTPNSAVETFFGGDETLFHAFRAASCRQFASDIADGDAYVAARDLPALQRVVHGLKSVLLTLGETPAWACARRIDERLAAHEDTLALEAWPELRRALVALGGP